MSTRNTGTSARITDAVARVKGVHTTALPPLYETIDSKVFELLFDSGSNPAGENPTDPYINFDYADCQVTVWANETVDVRELGSE